jgi:spore germination protein YaaH
MRLYDRAPMAARKVVRWLAPLALVAVIAAVYLVVHKTLAPKHKAQATTTSHQVVRGATKKTGPRRRASRRFYVVKAGDSLSAIAVKMKVSLKTLEDLNPKVNSNSLQTGQRLALQR